MQSRIIDGPQPQVARGVVANMHDLGYRITRVDAGSGTISATRADRLRVSAVVREQEAGRSVVRANAVILMQDGKLHEVDAVEFYQMNFFAPLTAMLGREAFAVPAESNVPEAVRPTPDRRPVTTATSPERPQ